MSYLKQSLPFGLTREEHKVNTDTDPVTGKVIRQQWYNKDGDLDRAHGPAMVDYDAVTGTATYELWWKGGKHDRADGPAVILRDDATGTVTAEAWYKDGKRDRADGPAVIYRDAAIGTVIDEAWYKDGKLDRADDPARIWRDAATGDVIDEDWYKNGKHVAPPSPVASEQDDILSLAAEFKTAVAAFGERLEALARKTAQKTVAPAPG